MIINDNKNFIIDPLTISFGKLTILSNTKLSIQYGERYGLVGKNGIGKTTVLNEIMRLAMLNNFTASDIIYVKQEEPDTNKSVIDTLLSADTELYAKNQRAIELEKLINDDNAPDIITDNIITEYDELCRSIGSDYIKSKNRARKILVGLEFDISSQSRPVSDFSGGWKMRLSLAKALFITPTILLLDEPSNHLDLNANIWLSEYLKSYPNTIVTVSHDKYLLDEICTTIIDIRNQKLNYYRGNYTHFLKQLEKSTEKQLKDYKQFEKKVAAMRKNNKSKTDIDLFIKKNAVTKPDKNYVVKMAFQQPLVINNPYVIIDNVTFGYNANAILTDVNLVINADTRIAIVGKNGAGKSTLLKLIVGDFVKCDDGCDDKCDDKCVDECNDGCIIGEFDKCVDNNLISGTITRANGLRIGYYNQHFEKYLPPELKPVDYLLNLNKSIGIQNSHKYLSMFGLEPIYHNTPIGNLSGGQKARVKFATFGVIKPHILILDEPTNHLDIVTTDSLTAALNNLNSAIVIVTHNFDMVTNLNTDLWVVDNGTAGKYNGDYEDYMCEIYEQVETECAHCE